MICDKCGCDHNLTCCPRCAGMGTHTGFYTSTIAAPDHRAERRRELLTVATAIYTHSDDGVGARLAVEAAINLIAAVDEFIKKDESP